MSTMGELVPIEQSTASVSTDEPVASDAMGDNTGGAVTRGKVQTSPRGRLNEEDESQVYSSVTSRTDLGHLVLNLGFKKKQNEYSLASHKKQTCSSYDGGQLASRLYAVIIVLIGVVIPVREALTRQWLTSYYVSAFLVYLYGVSIFFIVFLEVYLIRKARKHAHKYDDSPTEDTPDVFYKDGKTYNNPTFDYDHESQDELGTAEKGQVVLRSVSETHGPVELYIIHPSNEHAQCDHIKMPHHTSFYLRMGATVFGIGCMIYDGLLLKQLMDHNSPSSCENDSSIWWPSLVHLVFLMAQTYFIFKHPQVNVTSLKPLARFGFMHLFATNWCVWVRTLVRETLDSFLLHELETHSYNQTQGYNNDSSTDHRCDYGRDLLGKASPYLFPCVLEYSLLAVATMYSMHADIGIVSKQPKTTTNKKDDTIEIKGDTRERDDALEHPSHVLFTEINFHKAHTGLFAGVIVLAGTCVSVILFFSYLDYPNETTKNFTSLMAYHISEIILHCLLIVFSVTGWLGMRRLNSKVHSFTVDEVLLLTASAGFLLFELFRIQPYFTALSDGNHNVINILTLVGSILGMITCVVQSGFVFDSLTRYCKSRDDLKHKPGRGSVTFLLICNLAVWVFKTFQMKQVAIENQHPVNMYGYLAWGLIAHACIPLLMFYHYHCSACLAHVWSRGYHIRDDNKNNNANTTPNDSKLSDITSSQIFTISTDNPSEVGLPSVPVLHLRPRTATTSSTTSYKQSSTAAKPGITAVVVDVNDNVAEL